MTFMQPYTLGIHQSNVIRQSGKKSHDHVDLNHQVSSGGEVACLSVMMSDKVVTLYTGM